MLLTEQEIDDLYYTELDRRELSFARAIEAKVIAKIKAQGPIAHVRNKYGDPETFAERELLFDDNVIAKLPIGTKLYRLPEGE